VTGKLRVLDAGCGRNLHLSYQGLDLRDAYVVGIDVSRAELEQHVHLDEKIHDDL
jgi:2-polyprenyl-3-methyl-5-hydroxy-6-metoxy-1,4-benzoquinol methylase